MEKIYIDKNHIILKNYCKHGDLKISTRKYNYNINKNLCPKCSEEIINSGNKGILDRSQYLDIIEILKNPKKKISKDKLKLWYPYLYLEINSIKAKYWRQKVYMWVNKMESPPLCSCGRERNFNNKKGVFKDKCERCNRKSAVKKSSEEKSIILWRNIFKNYFKIDNPEFFSVDNYRISVKVNSEYRIFKKKHIHQFKKYGVLDIDNLILSEQEIEKNLENFRNKWDKYKNLSEEAIKNIHPILWRSLYLKNKNSFNVSNFNELKFLIKNNIKEIPKCKICEENATYNMSSYRYNYTCEKHKYSNFSSSKEESLYQFIQDNYSGEIIKNYRINGSEIDIFIPELKLGIEFNGMYWHSDKFLSKSYHYDKFIKFKKLGIDLLFVWEDRWDYKNDIIKSIINSRLGNFKNIIYARNCEVSQISFEESMKFLDDNHLQGRIPSKINIGLRYNGDLVSLMTFGYRNISKGKRYEILRYCNKKGVKIIGGASKIFNYFISIKEEDVDIISYSNPELFSGGLYEKLGFIFSGHTGIGYWWVKDGIRYHRSKFMKHRLVKEGWDKNLSEDEIMKKKGYYKIYDLGNFKWIYKCK